METGRFEVLLKSGQTISFPMNKEGADNLMDRWRKRQFGDWFTIQDLTVKTSSIVAMWFHKGD